MESTNFFGESIIKTLYERYCFCFSVFVIELLSILHFFMCGGSMNINEATIITGILSGLFD